MKIVLLLVAVLALERSGGYSDPSKTTLRLLHVFFRHGTRTPDELDMYPKDPYLNSPEILQVGYGQLTKEGKKRAYTLGQLLRRTYHDFLGDYTPETVLMTTTDFDRTKTSALLVLAGLFPPTPEQIWNYDLKWTPIPLHYVNFSQDYLLRRPQGYCPTFQKAYQDVLNSPRALEIFKENEDVLKYIEMHTGLNITRYLDVFLLYQTLRAEERMGLKLPEWTAEVYPDKIKELATLQCLWENFSDVQKLLSGGRVIKQALKHIMDKINGKLKPAGRKIYMYSAHDNNVINILAALDLYNPPHFPNYSSATIIELHLMDNNEYAIKIAYVRELKNGAENLTIPGCEIYCPLDKFLILMQNRIPKNYTEECQSGILLENDST